MLAVAVAAGRTLTGRIGTESRCPYADGGEVIGALNIYSSKPREWADQDISVAVVLADVATSYVLNVAKLHDQAEVVLDGVSADELVGVIDRDRFPWATPRAVGSAALLRIALPIYGYAT